MTQYCVVAQSAEGSETFIEAKTGTTALAGNQKGMTCGPGKGQFYLLQVILALVTHGLDQKRTIDEIH
jgi:hypothetical protein